MLLNAIDVELRVRALARTYPYRIYDNKSGDSGCCYTPDPHNPLGCIIGAAVAPLGVYLPEWDTVGGIIQSCDSRIEGDPQWLSNVQFRQDQGDSWSEAVAYGDAVRARLAPEPDLD